MTRDGEQADRMQAVREAARDWQRAGWIGQEGRLTIDSMYPDDRVRTGPAFRTLFFVLTLGGVVGAVGIAYAQTHSHILAAVVACMAGAACALATDYMLGPLKRRQGGIEAALSLAAIVNLIIGAAILLYEINEYPDRLNLTLLMFFLALLSGAAAWRWGFWPYAALSAYALFSGILALPAGRLLWVLGLLVSYRRLNVGCDAESLTPSHRKSAAAFLTVAIVALYAAVHVFILDPGRMLLGLGLAGGNPGELPRWLTIPLTALVPVAVFVVGVIERRRLFINLGFILAVASLLTLRYYFHLAPPWLLLTGSGILLLAAAAGLRRFLDSGRGRERFGFTAMPSGEDPGKRRAAEILAGVAVLTPGLPAAAEKPQFKGGGGEFGGGGASGEF